MIYDFEVTDHDSGVVYRPWTNGHAIGWECSHPNGRKVYLYLNPSVGSDDGVATVFPYQGRYGDPALDGAACDHHFEIFDAEGDPR